MKLPQLTYKVIPLEKICILAITHSQDQRQTNWAHGLRGTSLELSTLGYSSTHNTLQVLQRTALGPAPP